MARLMIIGKEPCTVEAILEIMASCPRFSTLSYKWQEMAQSFGVLPDLMETDVADWKGYVREMLHTWKTTRGDNAVIGDLCQKLEEIGAQDISEIVEGTFYWKILEHFLVDRDGLSFMKPLRMSDVMNMPPSLLNASKKNNPAQIVPQAQIPHLPQSSYKVGSIVHRLILRTVKEAQMGTLEDFCIWKTGLEQMTRDMKGAELKKDEETALGLLNKMNLNNFGRVYVLWMLAASVILKSEGVPDWKMYNVLKNVFDFVENGEDRLEELFKIQPHSRSLPHFRNLLLAYFIDVLLGIVEDEEFKREYKRDYKMSLIFDPRWLEKFALSSLKCNASNLLSNMSQLPNIMHIFVQSSSNLAGDRLEAVKKIIMHIIKKNSAAVNSLNHDQLPPILMHRVHVELVELLYNNHALIEAVSSEGRTIVHMAIEHLSFRQFLRLVQFLVGHNLDHLLRAEDRENKTPFMIFPQDLIANEDIPLLQLFAHTPREFNCTDVFGNTPLYYAVKRNRGIGILRALIEFGGDWRWKTWKGDSLLHIAAQEGNLGAVQHLVMIGHNINEPSAKGLTPLDYASFCRYDNREDVIDFLEEHGGVMKEINSNSDSDSN